MSLENALPIPAFPGFTHYGVVAGDVKEIATTFNAESPDALAGVPEPAIRWCEVGTRVTAGTFEVKIPIRLPSSMAFQPFDGNRSYNRLDIAAPLVRPMPFSLNFEWPIQIDQSGNAQLKEFYGAQGLAQTVVDAARAHKAQLVASVLYQGITNAALGLTAQVRTIPQPGQPNGLPLFTDGSETPSHYTHPFKSTSGRFANLFHGVGKLTDEGVFGDMLRRATQVPHPALPNMTMGLGVTDIIGPTHMLDAFVQMAVQRLSLQVSGTNFGATTNRYNPAELEAAIQDGRFIGASGLAPWRFWIAPQLDNHPYLVANPGKQMWLAVCDRPGQRWCELAAPSREFMPQTTLFGDADPQSRRSRQVSLIGDLDAGVAAGLPHFAQLYFETTPA